MAALTHPYCGPDAHATLLPAWEDDGIAPCTEATVGSTVAFVLAFFIGGSVSLMSKSQKDVLEQPLWMKRFEAICGVLAATTLIKLVGTCIAENTVEEFWVVDGLLTTAGWIAASSSDAASVNPRAAFFEYVPYIGCLATAWTSIALQPQAIVVAVSYRSKHWFWHHIHNAVGSHAVSAFLALINWTMSAFGALAMLLWYTSLVRHRHRRTHGVHLSVNDEESAPLIDTSRKRSTAVYQRTGSTFDGFSKKIGLLWPYVWPRRHPGLQLRVVVCIAALVGIRITNVMVPIAFKNIIDSLTVNHASDLNSLLDGSNTVSCPWNEIAIYVVLRFCQGGGIGSMGLLSNVRSYLWIPVQQYTSRELRVRLFKHFHDQDLKWHLSRKTGEVLRMMDRGSDSINNLLSYIIFNIAPTLIDIAIAVGYFTAKFGAYYGIIVFTTMGTYIWFTVSVTEWRTKFRRTMNTKDNATRQKATDSLLNAETVKLYLGEEYERKDYYNKIVDFQEHEWRSLASLSLLNVGQSVVITIGLAGGTLLCGYEVSQGMLTVGDFVLFITYITQLYMPLNWFGTYFRMIQAAFVDMENMLDLFEILPEVVTKQNARPLTISASRKSCSISFDNVYFSYNVERPILKGISFSVPAGKTCAIVGSTGSGKSTIMRLLFRFYDPDNGTVKIDGQDISKATLDSVRGIMGVVPQDTVLFHDTIRYNIRYGDRQASDEDVELASRGAEIHDAILGFPDQYETVVGERGLKLSGGEKQRVAIARSMLKKPLVVMLDEATSALDTQTERSIQATLNTLSRDRTTIVIAHRLSTIVNADEILVLDEGMIIERGVHSSLLAKGGTYSEMWNAQVQAMAENEDQK